MKRTYIEAVEIMVNLWVEESFKTPINQDNGDKSPSGDFVFLLSNLISSQAQKEVTEDKILKFKSKLTFDLLEAEGEGRYANQCHVDYNPNELLNNACKFAGIDTSCLPCKSHSYIDENNVVKGRFGYGSDFLEI